MDNKLTKSLTDLIDETLQELDELRKSRFSASEIKIEGPGDGIAGKPSDGDLHAKKGENEAAKSDDDDADDADDKDEDKDKKDKKDGMEKGVLDEAEKADDMDKKDDDDKDDKEDKKDDKKSDDKKEDKDDGKKAFAFMKKSLEDSDSLMKSYVEERVKPLEDKLSTILDLVNKIADQPVAPKGVSARAITPLLKSGDAGFEPLSKAQVASKLFELKKSGTKVDSLDITKAEMGQDLQQIVNKYEIS